MESRFCPNFLVGDTGSACWCQAQFNLKSVSDLSKPPQQTKQKQTEGGKSCICPNCRLVHIRRCGWGGAQRLQTGREGLRSRGQGAPVLHQVASTNLLSVNLLSKSAVVKYLLSKSAVVKYLAKGKVETRPLMRVSLIKMLLCMEPLTVPILIYSKKYLKLEKLLFKPNLLTNCNWCCSFVSRL